MAQQFATVEVWIICDSSGNSITGETADEAREHYEDHFGPLNEANGFRMVKVVCRIPLPEVAVVELEADAPEFEPPTAV